MTPAIDALDRRLETGWRLIDQARARNDHAEEAKLTEHWLAVLGEFYEASNPVLWHDPEQHRYWRTAA